MPTNTNDKIIAYVKMNKQARAHDLARAFHVSRVVIHRHLKTLVERGELKKVGKSPLVFYVLIPKTSTATIIGRASIIAVDTVAYINANYLYITPQGEMLYGFAGFEAWVKSIKADTRISHLSEEYVLTHTLAATNRSPT